MLCPLYSKGFRLLCHPDRCEIGSCRRLAAIYRSQENLSDALIQVDRVIELVTQQCDMTQDERIKRRYLSTCEDYHQFRSEIINELNL
jgi:hypothetical protein